jgi:hypothetical protein
MAQQWQIANWKDITVGTVTGSVILPGRSVTKIVVHATDPNIAFSGFQRTTSSMPGHVLRGISTDMRISWKWENISSNLLICLLNGISQKFCRFCYCNALKIAIIHFYCLPQL